MNHTINYSINRLIYKIKKDNILKYQYIDTNQSYFIYLLLFSIESIYSFLLFMF